MLLADVLHWMLPSLSESWYWVCYLSLRQSCGMSSYCTLFIWLRSWSTHGIAVLCNGKWSWNIGRLHTIRSKSIFVLNYLCSSNMPKSRLKVLTLFFISVINLWPEYCKTLQRDSLKFCRDNFNAFSKLNILTWNVQISTSTNLMFPYFHPQFDRSDRTIYLFSDFSSNYIFKWS